MTVAPVQDLIADVMAAADPVSQRVAAGRLERLASAADQNFAAAVDQKIEAAGLQTKCGIAADADDVRASGNALDDSTGHATDHQGERTATAPSIGSSKRSCCRCSSN